MSGTATSKVLDIALKTRSCYLGPLTPGFNISEYVRMLLDDFLPYNAHVTASGRLHISLTRVNDRKNVIINQFDHREDLIQVFTVINFSSDLLLLLLLFVEVLSHTW